MAVRNPTGCVIPKEVSPFRLIFQNHYMNLIRVSLLLLLGVMTLPQSIWSQALTRSGLPAPTEDLSSLRRFPCGGELVLEESFDGTTLPANWEVRDVDGLPPREEIVFLTPQGGWQSVLDFRDPDSVNRLMASPSWYEGSTARSDDYLILPPLTLPEDVCLSWYAYSQDPGFPESYEIRVSTSGTEPADFLANPPVLTIGAEETQFTYRSTSLDAYAGQTVYVAFRHTSQDKFILALDDIRLAQVKQRDMALFSVNPIFANPEDSVRIRGSIINRGLDTLTFDTARLEVNYQIDNGAVVTMPINKSITFVPNDTLNFVHDSAWVPLEDKVYTLKVWISGFGSDDNPVNDTLARFQGVGTFVSNESSQPAARFTLSPNPASAHLRLTGAGKLAAHYELQLMDLTGRILRAGLAWRPATGPVQLEVQDLPGGLYLLRLLAPDGSGQVLRWIKE